MRRFIAFGLMLALALPVTISAQVVQPAPPEGVALQVAGSSPGNISAGTWCGVYDLTDGGARWREVPGLRDVPVQRLIRLPDGILLATTAGRWPGGLWRFAPGEIWQRVLDVSTPQIAADEDGTHLYVAYAGPSGPSGMQTIVLRSDDRGRTWTEVSRVGGGSSWPVSIEVARDPATGTDVVLVAFQYGKAGGSGLIRSRDLGVTWEPFPGYVNNDFVQADFPRLFLDQDDATTFYVANTKRNFSNGSNTTRLYRASATGATLEEIALPPELQQLERGVVDLLAQGNTLIAADSHNVYRNDRSNATASWTRFDQNLGSPTIFDLHATADHTIYAGTSIGVYRYDNASSLWQPIGSGLPVCNSPGRTVFDPIPPFESYPDHRFFPESAHSLSFGFKAFWDRNGGLPVFGLPLSEEFDERNADLQRAFTTQYLERERFEYHPENAGTPFTVLLGRLGDELLKAQGRDWRQEGGTGNPFPSGTGGCRDFNVGGQSRSVCGPFLEYWRTHGLDLGRGGIGYDESLMLFGLPLTAPKMETNPDGDRVLTQWFERARFEYHPNNSEPYKVLLGRLGAEALRARGVAVR